MKIIKQGPAAVRSFAALQDYIVDSHNYPSGGELGGVLCSPSLGTSSQNSVPLGERAGEPVSLKSYC